LCPKSPSGADLSLASRTTRRPIIYYDEKQQLDSNSNSNHKAKINRVKEQQNTVAGTYNFSSVGACMQ